jgi:hypothetical protein
MSMTFKSILAMVLFLCFISCGDKSTDEPVVVPSNLEFTADVASDGSGVVTVTATADNASYFTITFGESTAETPIIANDGKATHTYIASGTYTITVLANKAISAYISKTQTVTVTVDDDNTDQIAIPTEGFESPESYEGMTLVWQDEFDAAGHLSQVTTTAGETMRNNTTAKRTPP